MRYRHCYLHRPGAKLAINCCNYRTPELEAARGAAPAFHPSDFVLTREGYAVYTRSSRG